MPKTATASINVLRDLETQLGTSHVESTDLSVIQARIEYLQARLGSQPPQAAVRRLPARLAIDPQTGAILPEGANFRPDPSDFGPGRAECTRM